MTDTGEDRVSNNDRDEGEQEESEHDRGVDADRSGDESTDGDEEDNEEEEEEEEDDDDNDDPLAHLPDYVLDRVNKLEELAGKRNEILQSYVAERAALEKKFADLYKPLYEERAKVVQGERDEEIAKEAVANRNAANLDNGLKSGEEDTANESENNADEPRVSGIPQFWVCAMTNNDTIGELISEDDVDCLESLQDITCVDREDGKGFTLYFHFAPNEYFEDSILEKSYEVPNLLLSDEPLLKNVKGTSIKWKADRALTYRMVKKKQRGKGKNAGKVRTVQKKEDLESFFRWFEPPSMPAMETMDEDEAEELEEVFEDDYEVAQAFRLGLIPNAVAWFTGQADNGDDDELQNAMGEDGTDVGE